MPHLMEFIKPPLKIQQARHETVTCHPKSLVFKVLENFGETIDVVGKVDMFIAHVMLVRVQPGKKRDVRRYGPGCRRETPLIYRKSPALRDSFETGSRLPP